MNGTNYEVPHCGAFSTPHFHPSFSQIFASGFCFLIPFAYIPPLSSDVLCDISEHPCFYSVRLLASRQTPKLEDHSWSAVHDCKGASLTKIIVALSKFDIVLSLNVTSISSFFFKFLLPPSVGIHSIHLLQSLLSPPTFQNSSIFSYYILYATNIGFPWSSSWFSSLLSFFHYLPWLHIPLHHAIQYPILLCRLWFSLLSSSRVNSIKKQIFV